MMSTETAQFSLSDKPRITVLALESSADDSCAAVVDSDRNVLSNIVIKQHQVNAEWGGIHPREAQYAHMANMPVAIAGALAEANMTLSQVDAIAFTRGPGMPGCLSVCGNAARALAAVSGKPLFGIHHMQAHALTPLLTESVPPTFPFLTLLVSGGHTQLVLAKGLNSFKILADSLDSYIGNAVDRMARYLKLPVSPSRGPGAMLEEYASLPPLTPYDKSPLPPLSIPLSMSDGKKTLAFSFSGLTSAGERLVDHISASGFGIRPEQASESSSVPRYARSLVVDEATQREIARVFQDAAIRHVVDKVQLALSSNIEGIDQVRGLVISGGVASNLMLRQRMQEMLQAQLARKSLPITLYFPPIALCTDNAAMIAWTAILRIRQGASPDSYDLMTRPKWSLEDLYDDLDA